MEIFAIIAIILVAIIIILLFSLLKSVLKAILISLMLISLLLGVGTYFVLKDAKDLKDNFFTQEKLIILSENEKVLAGFSFADFSSIDSLQTAKKSTLSSSQDAIDNNDFSSLTQQYYKILIINMSTFSKSLENGIKYPDNEELSLTKEQTKNTIYSTSPIDYMLDEVTPSQINGVAIPEEFDAKAKEEAKQMILKSIGANDEEEFKSFVFMLMFADLMMDEGPTVIVAKIKSKEILIYPNTPVFKALSFIPMSIVEKTAVELPSFEA